jgi:protein-S-isoprenylcysteine O-methyltransferase Ste14
MESPAVVLFAIVYASGANRLDLLPLLFLGMWMVHYVHRAFVFPFRLRSTHAMPVVIALASFMFQCVNGYANAAWISELGSYTSAWLSEPRLWLGVALFVVGEAINLHADTVLIGLRRPGEGGYKVPQGGMYRFVTSPNYLGEIVAWTGWALATWSHAGLAFAVFTVANLAPRAWTHHRWYREKFGEDYPRDRKVLIPFVW